MRNTDGTNSTRARMLSRVACALAVCIAGAAAAQVAQDPEEEAEEILNQPVAEKRADTLARNPDDKRPDNQFTTTLFGRPLTIGGEIGSTLRSREDFRLDPEALDDLTRFDIESQLEFFYAVNANTFAFAEIKSEYERDLSRENNREGSDSEFRRAETWLYLANLRGSAFSLQVGRQVFRDKREWWWNSELDALRLHYDRPAVHAEVAVAKELFGTIAGEGIDPLQDDVTRLMAHVSWAWARKQRLEFYLVSQSDDSSQPSVLEEFNEDNTDESDADLTWAGVHLRGRWKARELYGPLNRIYYWANFALVDGKETLTSFADADDDQVVTTGVVDRDIDGWGTDIGLTWISRLPGQPRLTLGYAYGSGDDDPATGRDGGFRQTGLQNNNGKYRGVDRFRYYGELLRPELANLRISTVAVGLPLWRNSSVEVLYHDYRQVNASPSLRVSRIGSGLNGIDRDVGREINIVVGLEEWKHLEIELIAAVFKAGDAYGDFKGETARNLALKFDYNF